MAADEAAWAEIRRLYCETVTPITQLCVLFNVSRTMFYERMQSQEWPRRPRRKRRPLAAPRPVAPSPQSVVTAVAPITPPPTRPPDTPESRVARFFRLLDLQLDKLENRMISQEPLTAEEEARLVRTMNTAVTNMERLTDAASGLVKPGDDLEGAAHGDKQLKAERLRREIAERLERLNAQWNATPKPE